MQHVQVEHYLALADNPPPGITEGTVYIYDMNGQLLAEWHTGDGSWREYVYLDGVPLAFITDDGTYHIHSDHLSTPQKLTDDNQQIVWDAVYEPFGQVTLTTELVTYNPRFPGQYFDEETGLHYNYSRDYDPSIGRYVQSDPIGLGDGPNTYAYAYSNPIRYTDPLGLWVKRCSRKLGDPNNPAKRPSGNPFRHDYLSVSGDILSFQAGDNMFWSQGRIDENEKPSNSLCVTVCDDDKFDGYVKSAAQEIGAPTYCVIAYPGTAYHMLGARNCQTLVDDVLRLAKKKYLEGEECPTCFK